MLRKTLEENKTNEKKTVGFQVQVCVGQTNIRTYSLPRQKGFDGFKVHAQ